MVVFKVKSNPQGQYYLPIEVRRELGKTLELICDARAGVLFPEGTSPQIVLDAMEVIKKDLEHRLKLEETNQ